jgi:hypothetical protein
MKRALHAAALCMGLAGCVTDSQKRDAINEVNETFRKEYEVILKDKGTRVYPVTPAQALDAMRPALGRLGLRVADQNPDIGYLAVVGPAPAPLNLKEWEIVNERDLPILRDIAKRHIGLLGNFIRFEPEGLEVQINAIMPRTPSGTEVSLTARMREIAPPQSGMPRREYLPPSAVRMGLDKIWSEFERELRSQRLL